MKTNFIMIAVAIAVLIPLHFARRELQRALDAPSPEPRLPAPGGAPRLPNPVGETRLPPSSPPSAMKILLTKNSKCDLI